VSRPTAQTALERRRARQTGFTLIELLVSMIILAIVGTMLVTTWISLQRAFEFTQADNTAASTGRDAIDRVASEVRAAQPCTLSPTTPFCLTLTTPYVCDNYDCTFYSPYNNKNAAANSGTSGQSAAVLTSIYLDTSGTTSQKKLKLWRDLNGNGVNDAGDQTILLATNVVNTAASVNRPIFTYVLDTNGNGVYTLANSLNSGNAKSVVAVKIEVVVDANLNNRPTYVDFVSTVRPRNVSTN
jgi:prepilin-type N-terminal cleavage/methylation domain-containing protein